MRTLITSETSCARLNEYFITDPLCVVNLGLILKICGEFGENLKHFKSISNEFSPDFKRCESNDKRSEEEIEPLQNIKFDYQFLMDKFDKFQSRESLLSYL